MEGKQHGMVRSNSVLARTFLAIVREAVLMHDQLAENCSYHYFIIRHNFWKRRSVGAKSKTINLEYISFIIDG